MHELFAYLALFQGAYFAATGLWPLLHMRSFLKVTGPKTDLWLVKTVGVLVLVIGVPLIIAGLEQRATPEIILLAAGAALGLLGIDTWYVARGVISPVYLLDAALEAVLLVAWGYVVLNGVPWFEAP